MPHPAPRSQFPSSFTAPSRFVPPFIEYHIINQRKMQRTVIERDIQDLAQVGKLNAFYDFLVFMAARTGQELKYGEIANAIGISAPTAKAWVSILERSGVIFILIVYE